jgi:hypothetical protein
MRSFDYNGKLYYAESILGYLEKYCDELAELILVNGLSENEVLREKRAVLRIWTGILDAFLIFLLGGTLLYVTSRITLPLGRLVVQARAISEGNSMSGSPSAIPSTPSAWSGRPSTPWPQASNR